MSETETGTPAIGRALRHLIDGIDQDFSRPASDVPYAVRTRLEAALESPDLYLDCAQLFLSQLVAEPDARVLFVDPGSRYRLQVFCWPPEFGNQPHLHENWNVTGVLVSSLLVFRSTISEVDCLASKPLLATSGQAGVLIPPQYHCLRNVGDQTAITFHVLSRDEPGDEDVHVERAPTSAARLDDSDILAIATVAVMRCGARSIDVVRTAFSAAGNFTKLELLKLMAKLDPLEAIRMGRALSQLVGGQDGLRLLQVIENLNIASRRGEL
ncbi:MAG: hypothetical protein WCC87_26100 [Candidatus Korobacteraceae bacterium]